MQSLVRWEVVDRVRDGDGRHGAEVGRESLLEIRGDVIVVRLEIVASVLRGEE